MSLYDQIVDSFNSNIEHKSKSGAEAVQKNKRPLKMPKNYDFSVRNVDWKQYERDFILRTDAVWEKSKLLDIFYTQYKVCNFYSSLIRISQDSFMTKSQTST